MERTKEIYNAEFPAGSTVKIAERPALEAFMQTWKLHNPLEPRQLDFAGQLAQVESVGFYFGGDELYKLRGIPGIWHERCLESVSP
jgi:hypothetical protein